MSVAIQPKIDHILNTYHSSSPRCKYHLHVTHDGIDRECYPKSFIYQLLVWEGNQMFTYHFEDWFDPSDKEKEFFRIDARPASDFFLDWNMFDIGEADFTEK